jgi:hypothetical protein
MAVTIYNSARLLNRDEKPNGSFVLARLFDAPGGGFIISGNPRELADKISPLGALRFPQLKIHSMKFLRVFAHARNGGVALFSC